MIHGKLQEDFEGAVPWTGVKLDLGVGEGGGIPGYSCNENISVSLHDTDWKFRHLHKDR